MGIQVINIAYKLSQQKYSITYYGYPVKSVFFRLCILTKGKNNPNDPILFNYIIHMII